MEKFHTDQQIGPTNNKYNLLGSWECAGYGECEVYYIDPSEIWSSAGVDHVLNTCQYDAAIISVYHHLPSHEVARRLGHKIAMLWWDAVVSLDGVKGWSRNVHQIIFDHGRGQEYPNVFSLPVPQDERIFFPDKTVDKDIDVSFVGSIADPWSDRAKVIQKIKDAGINIWSGGGRGHGANYSNLPIEEYAKIHKRSKINLNLSYGHGRPQRKGRVFEIAACGGFLMSNQPQMMRGKEGEFFGEETEFVSFTDDDIVEKIKYYLVHKEERDLISYRMYQSWVNNFSAKYFWRQVLNICGVNLP